MPTKRYFAGGDYATEGLIYACPGDVSSEAQWTSRKIKFDNGLGGETFSVFKETTGAGCSASFEMQGTEGWLTGSIGALLLLRISKRNMDGTDKPQVCRPAAGELWLFDGWRRDEHMVFSY
jgi:hypothetical protein